MPNGLQKTLMRLIGVKSDSLTPAQVATFGTGQNYGLGLTSTTYAQAAELLYERNVVGYKCVSTIASAVGALNWYLKQGDKEVESHKLLALLNRPNPLQGKGAFFTHAMGSKLLDGNTYIEMLGPSKEGVSRAAPPRELWVLRPDWVEANMSASRLPVSYVYRPAMVGGGPARVFPVNQTTGTSQLIHMMGYNPLFESNHGRGLAPAKAAWLSLLAYNEGQRWSHSLLRNGARPSGAFVEPPLKEGSSGMTQEEADRVRTELNNLYGGPENAGKFMLLLGGLDFKEMSLSPKDMDWLNGKNSHGADIALAYGVPGQLVGIPGSLTFANYEQARLSFYEDTVLPHAYALRDELNRTLVPLFGDGLELCIDEDAISALEPKREMKWARANAAQFLTINERRAMVGYDDIGPAGDEVMIPTSVLPLGSSIDDGETSEVE